MVNENRTIRVRLQPFDVRHERQISVQYLRMRPIEDVAADLSIAPSDLQPWGPGVATISPDGFFATIP